MNRRSISPFIITIFLLIIERFLIGGIVDNGVSIISFILQIQLFIIYFGVLIDSIKRIGKYHIYTLFIVTLGIFNFMGIFVGIFTAHNFRSAASFIKIELNDNIAQEVLWIFAIFTIVVHSSFLFFYYKYRKTSATQKNNIWQYSTDLKMYKLGRNVMLLFLMFVMYRSYIEMNFLRNNFTLIYVLGSKGIPIPSYIRIFTIFFQVGYMILISSKPPQKKIVIYSLMYILPMIPSLMIGIRGMFVVTVLFMIWYITKVYDYKFKLWKISLLLLPLIILLQIVALTREGIGISMSIIDMLLLFLISQSMSMYVLPLYIQYKDTMVAHNYPFILDPVIGWITGADGQSLEVLQQRSSLGHQLVYTLNPGYYLTGGSLGTNFIAELYEFGIAGILVGAIMFAWFIAKYDSLILKERKYLVFSFFITTFILFAPRSTFFPNVYLFLRYVLVYFIIMIVNEIVTPKKLSLQIK